MRSTFQVYQHDATSLFFAKNFTLGPNDAMITSLDGWDNPNNMTVETVDKLYGSGSYVTQIRLGELAIECEIHVPSDPRSVLYAIEAQAKSLNPVRMVRKYYTDDTAASIWRTEVIIGYITSITDYEEMGNQATIKFAVKCPDPTKTIS